MNYRTLFAALIGFGLVGAAVGGGLYVWRGQQACNFFPLTCTRTCMLP